MKKEVLICDKCEDLIKPRQGLKFHGNVYIVDHNINNNPSIIGNNFTDYTHQPGPEMCCEIDEDNAPAFSLFRKLKNLLGMTNQRSVIDTIMTSVEETHYCLKCVREVCLDFDVKRPRKATPILREHVDVDHPDYSR